MERERFEQAAATQQTLLGKSQPRAQRTLPTFLLLGKSRARARERIDKPARGKPLSRQTLSQALRKTGEDMAQRERRTLQALARLRRARLQRARQGAARRVETFLRFFQTMFDDAKRAFAADKDTLA